MRTLLLLCVLVANTACPPPECTADADCRPDACCHAQGAVPSDAAPTCDPDAPCTSEFVACSMDEDGAAPACRSGACTLSLPLACAVIDPLSE